jgi:hypothetical protein
MKKLQFLILLEVTSILAAPQVMADYCLLNDSARKMVLLQKYEPIPPLRIAEADSVLCEQHQIVSATDFEFPWKDTLKTYPGLMGGAMASFCITTDNPKKQCSESPKKNYSSLVEIEIPEKYESDFLDSIPESFLSQIIKANWRAIVWCTPDSARRLNDSYFVRITGECPDSVVAKYKKEAEK